VTPVDALTQWVAAIVDELVADGVGEFVICPGSRSTPLALAVARHPGARVWMQLDERSAAFFALGLARQTRRPAALLCTSGTAAANFLPAVAEADLSRVPMVVLTADRPPELRDNGAPQTIDQVGIYGPRVRWFSDLPTPGDTPELLRYARAAAARAVAASLAAPAGPTHLNLPFREPLVPDRAMLEDLFERRRNAHVTGPGDPTEAPGVAAPPTVRAVAGGRRIGDGPLATLGARLARAPRGLIICGPDSPAGLAPAVARLAAALGYPILADPLSGVRCGPHERGLVISAYDAFLRDERFAAHYGPELVLRFGAMPTAKPVLQFIQRHPRAYQVVVDEGGGWREPTSFAAEHLACDPAWLCEALVEGLGSRARATHEWARAWLDAEAVTRSAIADALSGEALSEPRVFAELAELLPDGATLFVGNSMPVRDCDTFFPASARRVTVMGNRGANGIDGLVSTALGAAAGGAGPLVMALGDISLYHDSNGLLAAKLHGLDATVVLINNDGGGIFSFLPQSSETDRFELLFGTPHGLDFRPLAELYGARYTLAEGWAGFREAVLAGIGGRGLHLVELRTERGQNVADHRRIWPLVGAALETAGLVQPEAQK
jgi:2-succinyl-5-enolpyruvyl-6-hydroxy-3-cyclohexene-1-carboxylate synthase